MDTIFRTARSLAAVALTCLATTLLLSCRASGPQQRTFAAPEDAVRALIAAVETGRIPELLAIVGPQANELIDSSDPATARRNREVFMAAAAEQWRLVDQGTNGKGLVVGNEEWPFPIPLVKETTGWRFDTAAGIEEIIARRIGRNELAAIRICRTYVAAQRLYGRKGHDGQSAGIFARTLRSDPGRQNGLYWPAAAGQPRSPLGDLVAHAAGEGALAAESRPPASPFHGYYFKILTAQGPAAAGGAKDYLVNGTMSGGFALVAWPAQYDVTGIMTFLVNHDDVVWERDLGAETEQVIKTMSLYNPDASWARAQ